MLEVFEGIWNLLLQIWSICNTLHLQQNYRFLRRSSTWAIKWSWKELNNGSAKNLSQTFFKQKHTYCPNWVIKFFFLKHVSLISSFLLWQQLFWKRSFLQEIVYPEHLSDIFSIYVSWYVCKVPPWLLLVNP